MRKLPVIASSVVASCVAAFVALEAAAMALYPGGTWWDRNTRGASFWRNYVCDLEWSVALNGQPNRVGAPLAEAAMLVMVAGLGVFWWIAPAMFAGRRRTGTAVRALGLVSVAGIVAVACMPSERFGALHGVAVVVAGVPGLTAALLAVAGMLRGDRAKHARAAGAVGAAMLAFALVDFALYADTLAHGGPGSTLLPVAQKIALVLLVAWMLLVAARAR